MATRPPAAAALRALLVMATASSLMVVPRRGYRIGRGHPQSDGELPRIQVLIWLPQVPNQNKGHLGTLRTLRLRGGVWLGGRFAADSEQLRDYKNARKELQKRFPGAPLQHHFNLHQSFERVSLSISRRGVDRLYMHPTVQHDPDYHEPNFSEMGRDEMELDKRERQMQETATAFCQNCWERGLGVRMGLWRSPLLAHDVLISLVVIMSALVGFVAGRR
eukprot:jgi/Bigna1/82514/fgenesh1_pg.93_\